MDDTAQAHTARRDAMALLAQGAVDTIERGLGHLRIDSKWTEIRSPETGLVMLRGRVGGMGAPFNLGEATVTRAAVQLDSGETGFAYLLGRNGKKARLAALCDALWQSKETREGIERCVLTPLREERSRRLEQECARTAATRVDFFTLVRGEDER